MKVFHIFSSYPSRYQPYNERLIQGLMEVKNSNIQVISKNKPKVNRLDYKVFYVNKVGLNRIFKKIVIDVICFIKNYKILKNLSFKHRKILVEKYFFLIDNKNAIFHFHNIQSIHSVAIDFMINNNIKYIVSLRGYDVTIFPLLSERNKSFLCKVLNGANRIHSVCDELKDRVIKGFNISDDKIVTIQRTPNISNVFNVFNHQTLEGCINIFTLSRIHWKKGLSESLLAIKKLIEDGYNINYHIFGGIEIQNTEFEKLKFLINELGLNNIIHFHDFIPESEFTKHFQNMHIFWIPSMNEGIPNTLYYALKCGFPIVASNANGIPEIIKNEQNGLLFSNLDYHDLFIKTKEMINNNELRSKIQRNAKVTELQTLEKEVYAYIKLYEI